MTQADRDEVVRLLGLMFAYYSKRPDPGVVDLYRQDLRYISADCLQKAFDDFRADPGRKHYMPTIAEIKQKVPQEVYGYLSTDHCDILNCVLMSLRNEGIKKDGSKRWLCELHSEEFREAEKIVKYREMDMMKNKKFMAIGRLRKWIDYWEEYFGVKK